MVNLPLRIPAVLLPALLSGDRSILRLVQTAVDPISLYPLWRREALEIEFTIRNGWQFAITAKKQIRYDADLRVFAPAWS